MKKKFRDLGSRIVRQVFVPDDVHKESIADVKKGVGISVGIYGCSPDGADASTVKVELNPDNIVTVYNSWEDHGQGANIGTLGTAHKALRPLGLKPEQIKLVMNDTGITPNSGPTGGSRQQLVIRYLWILVRPHRIVC